MDPAQLETEGEDRFRKELLRAPPELLAQAPSYPLTFPVQETEVQN